MIRARYLVLVPLLFLFTGCAGVLLFGAGAATGVAGYKYYKGSLTVVFEASFKETFDAAKTALEQLNMDIERSERGVTSGNIVARRSDNKEVSISLNYRAAKETEAVIRIGTFGEKEASVAIKDRITKVLFGQ